MNLNSVNLSDILDEYSPEQLTEIASDIAMDLDFVYDLSKSTESCVRSVATHLLDLQCEIVSNKHIQIPNSYVVFLENGEWGIGLQNELGFLDMVTALFLYKKFKNTNTNIKFDFISHVKSKYLEVGFLTRTDRLVEDMLIFGGDIRQIQFKYALPFNMLQFRLGLLKND